VAGVHFLEVGDARIGEKFGVELSPADIHADHVGSAGLEGAIGKAARGSADVEDVGAGEIEAKSGEGGGEFFAPAADEARRLFDGEFAVGGEVAAGFVETFGTAAHAAGHNEGLGLGAGSGEATDDEEFIEADFFGGCGHVGKGEGPEVPAGPGSLPGNLGGPDAEFLGAGGGAQFCVEADELGLGVDEAEAAKAIEVAGVGGA